MHLTMDQLLALEGPTNEPGLASARDHLAACAGCQRERDRLHQRQARLRALPTLYPARDQWPAVSARLELERRRRRLRQAAVGVSALAAVVMLALLLRPMVPVGRDASTVSAEEIAAAKQQSRALEAVIAQYGPDRRVLDGRTAGIAAELEDRIGLLDRQLQAVEIPARGAADAQVLELWRERVGLLDALVDVHVTRANQVGL